MDAAATQPSPAPILRYLITPLATPLASQPLALAADRVILVTDDEQGLAETVAATLHGRGHRVVLLSTKSKLAEGKVPNCAIDLTDAHALRACLDEIRHQYGPPGSLLHLAPLRMRMTDHVNIDEWRRAWQSDLVGLLHLIHGLQADFTAAAQTGDACVLAATGLGRLLFDAVAFRHGTREHGTRERRLGRGPLLPAARGQRRLAQDIRPRAPGDSGQGRRSQPEAADLEPNAGAAAGVDGGRRRGRGRLRRAGALHAPADARPRCGARPRSHRARFGVGDSDYGWRARNHGPGSGGPGPPPSARA